MPRYMQIPADVHFVNLLTKEPQLVKTAEGKDEPYTLSFRKFYLTVLSNDPRLSTVKGGRALYKFEQAYDDAMKTDDLVMVLDQDVWELWKDMATNPKYQVAGGMGPVTHDGFLGYTGAGVMQLLPFVDAIEGAKEKKGDVVLNPAQMKKPVMHTAGYCAPVVVDEHAAS